jgi:hypothetical protein
VAAGDIAPVPGAQFEETLVSASPDVLRAVIREFAQRIMDADVEVACNAGYGEVTPDRVNSRSGYRRREWNTRAGTIEMVQRKAGLSVSPRPHQRHPPRSGPAQEHLCPRGSDLAPLGRPSHPGRSRRCPVRLQPGHRTQCGAG